MDLCCTDEPLTDVELAAVNRLAILWPLHTYENGKLKVAFHHAGS